MHCLQDDSQQVPSRSLFGVFNNNKRCEAEATHPFCRAVVFLHQADLRHTVGRSCLWSVMLLAAGLPQSHTFTFTKIKLCLLVFFVCRAIPSYPCITIQAWSSSLGESVSQLLSWLQVTQQHQDQQMLSFSIIAMQHH